VKKLTILTAILIATSAFAQVPNYVPTNGLVGWWPFNFNANDESGNGNNGTINGALPCQDRFLNPVSAYEFNGSNSSIFISNAFDLPIRTSNIWFLATISTNNNSVLFSTRNPNLQNGRSSITLNNDNLCMGYSGGTNGCGLIPLNNWHMATIVRNLDSTRHYIDGELISTSILGFDPGNSGQLGLSLGVTTSGYGYFNGKIDDVGIWNRALTECEIQDLFNSQFGSAVTTSTQTQTALDTYTWPVNNQTYTQSGTYSEILVNAAGCDSIITLNLILSFTDINDLNASTISISPNPTAGDFTIAGLELYKIGTMRITDVNGKLVKELDPTATKFTLATAKPGVYFLTITAVNKQEVIKVIKE
jgi:hypothetical protein